MMKGVAVLPMFRMLLFAGIFGVGLLPLWTAQAAVSSSQGRITEIRILGVERIEP